MDEEHTKLIIEEAKVGMDEGCPHCSYIYTLAAALLEAEKKAKEDA